MKKVIAGVETNYQQMGKGLPIILLHGWGCDWQIWHPIISRFSDQFQLIIPDLPAFGSSANPSTPWDSEQYATWLTAFIAETLSPTRSFLIMGHSFGGKVAALYAATSHNNYLKKVILVDASGIPDPLTSQQQFKQRLVQLIPGFLKNTLSAPQRNKILSQLQLSTDHATSTPAQREILKLVVREDISQSLVQLRLPTLLIWGEHDQDTPLHQGRRFQSLIPDSRLVTIPNAGHFPFIDQPVQFMTQLNDFILPSA